MSRWPVNVARLCSQVLCEHAQAEAQHAQHSGWCFALTEPAAEMQFLSRLLCCRARNEATFSSPPRISQHSGDMASRSVPGSALARSLARLL